VDGAERRVTVADRVDQDPDADQIVDVVEPDVPGDHLLVDRVIVLGAAADRGPDLGLAQVTGDVLDDLLQEHVPARGPLGHQPGDLVVPLGVHGREGQVLQLPLDRVHAEPVGQRGEDLQRLAGLAFLLVPGQVAQCPHVVQPVGQLDHQHPDVAGHGHDHLADGLGLGRVAVLDLVQLGHAVDQGRDVLAEVTAQLGQRVRGVLHGVVQQGRADRVGVHAELGEDRRHRQRVGDVRVAALALLVAVPVGGDVVGALDQPHVRLGVGGPHGLDQRLEDGVHRGDPLGPEPGQAAAHAGTRRGRGGGTGSGRRGAGPLRLGMLGCVGKLGCLGRLGCRCGILGLAGLARLVIGGRGGRAVRRRHGPAGHVAVGRYLGGVVVRALCAGRVGRGGAGSGRAS
jgi:hypothetical protein